MLAMDVFLYLSDAPSKTTSHHASSLSLPPQASAAGAKTHGGQLTFSPLLDQETHWNIDEKIDIALMFVY
ncbi:hypothetical protein EYF80_010214 [Liparis tanakae]|uniref:Uncharacterized protein n=1 Tax=Liparis tanakae TaxID=230148 RepID=A0A4Z2IQX2_9TELE|nr:hypothetical protein EYF80_010214 [Liparis tanakae]